MATLQITNQLMPKDPFGINWSTRDSPMYHPSDLTNAVALASGLEHTLALKSDGTVAAWGYYLSGRTAVPACKCQILTTAGEAGGTSLAGAAGAGLAVPTVVVLVRVTAAAPLAFGRVIPFSFFGP